MAHCYRCFLFLCTFWVYSIANSSTYSRVKNTGGRHLFREKNNLDTASAHGCHTCARTDLGPAYSMEHLHPSMYKPSRILKETLTLHESRAFPITAKVIHFFGKKLFIHHVFVFRESTVFFCWNYMSDFLLHTKKELIPGGIYMPQTCHRKTSSRPDSPCVLGTGEDLMNYSKNVEWEILDTLLEAATILRKINASF